jgi:hypothetical protein
VIERYSLAEVVRRTGAKRRAIQLWADGGVIFSTIESDRAGTGNHRLFEAMEVQIAALLAPLANLSVQIGVLKRFAMVMRQSLFSRLPGAVPDMLEEGTPIIGQVLVRASRGEGANWLLIAYSQDYINIGTATDADGPVEIDPQKMLPDDATKDTMIAILNLTAILGSLAVELRR